MEGISALTTLSYHFFKIFLLESVFGFVNNKKKSCYHKTLDGEGPKLCDIAL